jgi:hypothetical protein
MRLRDIFATFSHRRSIDNIDTKDELLGRIMVEMKDAVEHLARQANPIPSATRIISQKRVKFHAIPARNFISASGAALRTDSWGF